MLSSPCGLLSSASICLKLNNSLKETHDDTVAVAKIFSSRRFRLSTLRFILSASWHGIKEWFVRELESPNTFIFHFQGSADREWVFQRRAWSVNGAHLLIRDWPSSISMDRI
ncbi:hypothetical protein L484_021809 [Morus notabilis]|uniref:DUF4283 domain-containing protein n=1 Tax=Morus notabilis TaxID=981085 RepID=W9QSN8_9ROSA|nr:hypothetical protein L484_021809 [Morus notabilis]